MSSFLPPIFNSNIRYSKAIDILRSFATLSIRKTLYVPTAKFNAEKKICVCDVCVRNNMRLVFSVKN